MLRNSLQILYMYLTNSSTFYSSLKLRNNMEIITTSVVLKLLLIKWLTECLLLDYGCAKIHNQYLCFATTTTFSAQFISSQSSKFSTEGQSYLISKVDILEPVQETVTYLMRAWQIGTVTQEEIFNVRWVNRGVVLHEIGNKSLWCTLDRVKQK